MAPDRKPNSADILLYFPAIPPPSHRRPAQPLLSCSLQLLIGSLLPSMHIAPLLFFPLLVRAGLHSLPEDPYAFPKYRVAFLNAHPVLNHTAEHWLAYGLRGGESEFLEQWASSDDSTASPQPKEIDPPNPPVDTLAPNVGSLSIQSSRH